MPKLNISYPATGAQKLIEVDDEKKWRLLFDKRIANEIEADFLGEQYAGYVFRITGGIDKQGFPMKQGVLVPNRVRLLLDKDSGCYRPKRKGERRRRSVRGCIISPDIAVVHVVIVKKGEQELEGLTDKYIPRRLGPKRASKIRKFFNLSKEDDVRQYVIRREIPGKDGKPNKTKAPKIQRLVTPVTLQRKRRRLAKKIESARRTREQRAAYAKMLAERQRQKRKALASKRKSIRQSIISAKRASAVKATSS